MAKRKHPAAAGKCAKVPVILQMEQRESGAVCLAMILAYYGRWVPLEQVRGDCGVSRDGSGTKGILSAAQGYGLLPLEISRTTAELQKEGQFPSILRWGHGQFVVLNGFLGNHAVINDPEQGMCRVGMSQFDELYQGVCLRMEPSEHFTPGGSRESVLTFMKKQLKGTKAAVIFTVLVSLITALIGVIDPVFSRVFLDRLITRSNPDWAAPFFILLTAFAAIQITLEILRAIYALKIEGKLAITANARYMWHVLRLPVGFFDQRLPADIADRKRTNESISSVIINMLAPAAFDLLMMIVYLTIILRYSLFLTLLGISGMVLNIFVEQFYAGKRIEIMRLKLRDQAQLSSATVAGIEMIETIKASGSENGFFARWAGYQAAVNALNAREVQLVRYYRLLPRIFTELVNASILSAGILLIMNGQFTVGILMAFQTMLRSFMEPVENLAETGLSIREMRANMERIEDVMQYPEDVKDGTNSSTNHDAGSSGNDGKRRRTTVNANAAANDNSNSAANANGSEQERTSYQKLSGKIELKDISFGYTKFAPPLIEHFNMTVEPGQKIAFVGGSGCGKSTLSKLISGLYQPWSGEILFDGKPISDIDRNIFTGSLAVVDQDIVLFEDTIANNIKMWDSSIEDYEMILASRDASLHADVMQRDGGYAYQMSEGGRDFSGGQRQRMEIARVLAEDPTILIMDEATSALDAQTEHDIVQAIHDRGVTCIVIAHRLSTIRDCDEIIVMDHGKIVERGRHDELMQRRGLYEKLIKSE